MRPNRLRSKHATYDSILTALFATTLGMGFTSTVSADEATQRDLTVEQNAVYAVQSVQSTQGGSSATSTALNVTAWVDQADNTYAIGEKVRLFVKANKDAYITVLNVGASGKSTVLFPNQFQKDNKVAANKVAEIPGPAAPAGITVSGPVGKELIKVIASTTPTEPASLFGGAGLTTAGAFKSVNGGARSVARDLQVSLNALHTQGPKAEWDDYNKIIRTVEGQQVSVSATVPAASSSPVFVVASPPSFSNQRKCTPQTPGSGVTLATDKQVYSVGEPMQVAVSTDRSCHLTLVSYNARGQVAVLFPNRIQPNNLLQAGQTILLPGQGTGLQLTATGPAGIENLVAVCSTQETPVFGSGYNFAQVFHTIADRKKATRDLGLVINQSESETAQAMLGVLITP